MAIAMSLNGIGRELLLRRFFVGRSADIVSAILGVMLIGLITRVGFRPLAVARPRAKELGRVSVALLVSTVAFESALGRFIDHKSWEQILEHYAIWNGELWPVVLAWLVATPFFWARRLRGEGHDRS